MPMRQAGLAVRSAVSMFFTHQFCMFLGICVTTWMGWRGPKNCSALVNRAKGGNHRVAQASNRIKSSSDMQQDITEFAHNNSEKSTCDVCSTLLRQALGNCVPTKSTRTGKLIKVLLPGQGLQQGLGSTRVAHSVAA